jgi:hypothetical protein
MRSSTSILALLATSTLGSPVALLDSSLSAREADACARFEVSNPLSKRDIKLDTVNALTPAQITAQRNALFLAQTETAREAILFPNAPNAANDTFQFINNSKSICTKQHMIYTLTLHLLLS